MAKITKEERDANESRNIGVINDFTNHWHDNGIDLRSNDVGLYFKAQISYSSPNRSIVERTDVRVRLSGYGTDGMIDIIETENLTVNDYHLRILPPFGTYKLLISTGEMVISNESEKMGGKYSIRILPIG